MCVYIYINLQIYIHIYVNLNVCINIYIYHTHLRLFSRRSRHHHAASRCHYALRRARITALLPTPIYVTHESDLFISVILMHSYFEHDSCVCEFSNFICKNTRIWAAVHTKLCYTWEWFVNICNDAAHTKSCYSWE